MLSVVQSGTGHYWWALAIKCRWQGRCLSGQLELHHGLDTFASALASARIFSTAPSGLGWPVTGELISSRHSIYFHSIQIDFLSLPTIAPYVISGTFFLLAR